MLMDGLGLALQVVLLMHCTALYANIMLNNLSLKSLFLAEISSLRSTVGALLKFFSRVDIPDFLIYICICQYFHKILLAHTHVFIYICIYL